MTAHDTNTTRGDGISAVTRFPPHGKAVVKGDTFTQPVELYVGTGGTVVVTTEGGEVDTPFVVPTGGMVPCRIMGITSAGTDADDLVAVW